VHAGGPSLVDRKFEPFEAIPATTNDVSSELGQYPIERLEGLYVAKWRWQTQLPVGRLVRGLEIGMSQLSLASTARV
jgi:hypothetical protein